MGLHRRVCLFLVLLCSLGAVALFEDEAGKYDWYKEKIGAVTQAVFPASPRLVKKRLVFVATEEGVVAALNLQTGNVAWRKVLARGEAIRAIRLYDRTLLFVSGDRHLHACDAEEGTTTWTALLQPVASGPVMFKGFLTSPARTAAVLGIEQPADPAGLPALHIFTFNVQDGTGLAEQTVPLPPDVVEPRTWATDAQRQRWLTSHVQLTRMGLVLLNPERRTATHIDGTTYASSTVDLSPHAPASDTPATLPNAYQQCPNVLVQLSPTTCLVLGFSNQALRITHIISKGEVDRLVVCDDSLEEGQGPLVLRYQVGLDDALLQLRTVPAAIADQLTAVQLDALAPDLLQLALPGGWSSGNDLSLAVVNAYASKGRALAYRVLVGLEDAELGLFQGTGQAWRRLEGLASVVDAQFINLPKPHTHQPNTENLFLTRIGQRVLLQAVNLREQLTSFAQWVVEETLSQVQGVPVARGEAAEDSVDAGLALTQDEFGFRKMIVANSKKTATLFAIHTLRGRVVWKHFVRHTALAELLRQQRKELSPAEFLRFSANCEVEVVAGHSLDERHGLALWHDYLAVVAVAIHDSPLSRLSGAPAREHQTVVLKFEVQSGNITDARVFPFRPVHIAMLPFHFLVGTVSSTPLLLVDAALKPHLYPDVAPAWEALKHNAARVFFHVMDATAGRCVGYALSTNGRTCHEAWRMVLDRERGETVVGVSTTTLDRRAVMVHNTVRLFNNKTGANAAGSDYGFTYINPNAFAIATAVPAPANMDDKKSKAGPSLNLYLLDGITGSILAQTIHVNAVPPVALLQVENFLFYHFLSTKTMKYQLGTWQLFEDVSDAASHTVAQGLLNSITGAQLPPRSAFLVPPPLITRALYNFPTAMSCLGTSVTTKGITTKLVLAGNPLGQVVGLPLPLLEDPKAHHISYPLQFVVTYNKTVHHLRAIRTAPASLESSSHMLAIGLDLFYTRVAPAKAFDLLGEDFSHWLLLATTSALLVSTVVAKGFAKRRTLALAWA
eukprot:GGOE01019889.1.p1 GENE.GGOE01019889.1~~GGOE01019889.1.p1  ORF type:complete len:1012 (+),score=325.31 GGOE01019889.1:17-3052(+)